MVQSVFNPDFSYNSKCFEAKGKRFEIVGSYQTGYKASESIDEYIDLETGQKYSTNRVALIEWMEKNNAKVLQMSI